MEKGNEMGDNDGFILINFRSLSLPLPVSPGALREGKQDSVIAGIAHW